MTDGDVAAIIAVSDFHMTVGRDPRTGLVDRRESFDHDAAFARFLAAMREQAAADGRPWRLLILGDLFDFLRVGDAISGDVADQPDNSERAALAKLERIAAGHGVAFAALGAFAAAGCPIDLVAGNHDIELTRPAVQARLRDLIGRAAGDTAAGRLIRVHPWIFSVPGLLYAEHGQQYHDLNSFPALLRSSAGGPGAPIEPPLGSFWETYRIGLAQSLAGAHEVKPRGVLRMLGRSTVVAGAARRHLTFAGHLVRDLAGRRSRRQAARRAAYRRQVLADHADAIGLPLRTLGRIDQTAEAAARALPGRIVRSLLGARIPRRRGRARSAAEPVPYLARAALTIHHLLQADGLDVPYYLFGHTHRADQRPLLGGSDSPQYLNTGSWGDASRAASSGAGVFPYVQIRPASAGAPAVASLLVWTDDEERQRPLRAADDAAD